MSVDQLSRAELFETFMGNTGSVLDRIEPGMFDSAIGGIVPELRRIHSEAFMPEIVDGRVTLTSEQIASNGTMIIPLLGSDETVQVPASAYGCTPRRAALVADMLGVSVEEGEQLGLVMLTTVGKRVGDLAVATTANEPVTVANVIETFKPQEGSPDPAMTFVGRSAVLVHPAILQYQPDEQGAAGVHDYVHVHDAQEEREPLFPGEELKRHSYLELRAYHVGSRTLTALGVDRDASEMAKLTHRVEAERIRNLTDPADPFAPTKQIMPILLTLGIYPRSSKPGTPPRPTGAYITTASL